MDPTPTSSSEPGTAEAGTGLRARAGLVVGLVALVTTLVVPAPGSLDPAAWRMAGVAVLMASWWIGEVVPLAATSLVPLVAFPLLGILPSATTAREYGNHLVYLFFGGFLLAIAMERWNLHRRIALVVLTRFGTRPDRLLVGFALSVAFLSMWVSNTATALMTLPVAMAVVGHLVEHATLDGVTSADARTRARNTLAPVFLLTVAYASSAGGVATLVGTPPNIVLAGALQELGVIAEPLSFARWLLLGLPTSLVLLALILFWTPRLGGQEPITNFRGDPEVRRLLREERNALGRMGRGERTVLAVFASTVLLWLSRVPLELGALHVPGWSSLLARPGDVHDATVAIAAGIVLMSLRAPRPDDPRRTQPVLDWHSVRHRVPWEVLLLFGGGFALARGFETTGLSHALADRLTLLGSAPLPVLILGVCLMTTFLTEVTSNTATATVLMPVLAATGEAIGVDPAVLMVPAALSASCAFMLPVATPPNAVVFGSGWVSVQQMARVGLVLNLSGAFVLTLLCWALAPWVF